jgi:thioredoxin-related protein
VAGWLLVLLVSAAPVVPAADSRIAWHTFAEGEMLRREEGKTAMIYFHAVWCQFCTQMEKETFTDPGVVDLVNRYFIPIRVDVDEQRKVAAQFGIRGLPATVFMMDGERRIGPVPGFMPADRFVMLLKQTR